MSDAPTPPDLPPDSPTPLAGPKRPWTILGRLAQAVREQNWFAVALELVIVVLGVVIGFQITAWGQERADRVTEQAYLRQLVADLAETERLMTEIDSLLVPIDSAGTLLVHAFYQATPPDGDSLQALILRSHRIRVTQPVLGTAEALVATGDLGLVRSDTLRAALTTYLDHMRTLNATNADIQRRWLDTVFDHYALVDYPTMLKRVHPLSALDSLRRAEPYVPTPPANRVVPPPFDVPSFLANREIRTVVHDLNVHKRNLWLLRGMMRTAAQEMRAQIEAELNR